MCRPSGQLARKHELRNYTPDEPINLTFNEELMDDERTLSSYNIQNDAELTLGKPDGHDIQISLKNLKGKTILLNISSLDIVATIKFEIQEKENIPVQQQR
eukprot:14810295-Heterocapsa_arctica.AAC.1